jgi:hypothetical protein
MAIINWTHRSVNDLKNIAEFIEKDSVKYASLTIQCLMNAAHHPDTSGRQRHIPPNIAGITTARLIKNNIILYLYENICVMTLSDLKLKIFRQIDSLEKNRLEEFYGVMMNYLNSKKDITDWEKLSEAQKKGLLDAIDEIESGKGKSNKAVLDKFHKKYSNS